MNSEILNDTNSVCNNSKINIKADNYSKTKTFNVENAIDQRLSRVDSSNYPDTTNDLDNLAQKMGFNQQNNNVSSCKLVTLTKLDRCSEEKINEKGLSKSFQVSTDKPLVLTPNKLPHKKSGFMSNIINRLSISTPKMFSKNKKIRKSKRNLEDDSVEHKAESLKNNESLSNNGDKIVNGVSDKNSPNTPKSKSIKRFLQKLGKKKGKGKVTSEPPSSIESRPSLSSVVNHGLNYETTTSCNDIFLNKVSKDDFQKYNCSSADCILDYPKNIKSNKQHESVSSTSEDLIDHEAKLNAVINIIPNEQLSEFPCVEQPIVSNDKDNLSPQSIKTNDFKFETQRSCHSTMSGSYHAENSNNVKLTLALYGYTNYGLSSSRLASKSCMEFRSATMNKKMKLSMDNVSIDKVARLSKTIDYREKNQHDKDCKKIEKPVTMTEECTKINELIEQDVTVREDDSSRNSESTVVLRKSQRPNDIKLRKSREPSQNLVARSSMIMLVVSHNSPRSKIVSNQLTTPNKDIDLNNSLNGNNQLFSNIPAMKLNFDNLSIKDRKSESEDNTNDNEKKLISSDAFVDNNIKLIENGFDENKPEIIDGTYFLNLVHKHENDILKKIDIVQGYLDSENSTYEDDVSGQLLVTIGKAKLLLSEKMLQFKGLCEKNICGIIEENELPTLLSDLNGFWDMVFGQIEDVNKNFSLVEKIRQNDWKMIPYEIKEKSSLNTPARSKRSTGSRPAIGQSRNTPILAKKKPSSDSIQQSNAEKRKNMMKFKLNQKASMSQQNADPNFSNDITFY